MKQSLFDNPRSKLKESGEEKPLENPFEFLNPPNDGGPHGPVDHSASKFDIINRPIAAFRRMSAARLKLLEKLGLKTIGDCLDNYPRSYLDRSELLSICDAGRSSQVETIHGKVADKKDIPTRAGQSFTKIFIYDGTDGAALVAFGKRAGYLKKSLKLGDPVVVSGKFKRSDWGVETTTFEYEKLTDEEADLIHTGRIAPVYQLTAGLQQRSMRSLMAEIAREYADAMPETIPLETRLKHSLVGRARAALQIHLPDSHEELRQARRRIIFEEFYLLQLGLLWRKQRHETEREGIVFRTDGEKEQRPVRRHSRVSGNPEAVQRSSASIRPHVPTKETASEIEADVRSPRPVNRLPQGDVDSGKTVVSAARKQGHETGRSGIEFKTDGEKAQALLNSLPFQLTKAQRRVLDEIEEDMRSPRPMNRLLQGDVGSGKTVVSAMAIAHAVDNGYQGVLMAPTEALAHQHYETMRGFLSPVGIQTVLLKGGMSAGERRTALNALETSYAGAAVGTHALIEPDVEFARLGLAVVDEQHRFGVIQRARLADKGKSPDILVMTATPIPRTLALTAYGDLSQSVIDELPAGRIPVETKRYNETRTDLERLLRFLENELRKGRQAYVVYPLVESSEAMGDIRDAVEGHRRLSNRLPDWNVGLLHGRMSGAEKLEAMEKFKSGETHVLVSTTVIEVGIDVPNASLMIVIHADRFGLSQLHQLRGRVGRGPHQSYCALVGWGKTDESQARLEAMVQTTDGFEIAEKDLEIRGPGEVLGTRQSGLPDLTMAHLTRDSEALKAARDAAAAFIDENPDLGGQGCDAVRAWLSRKWGGRLRLASVG